jgi:tetratricopeptide (TPR) repeat protein
MVKKDKSYFDPSDPNDPTNLVMTGYKLKPSAVAVLEERLKRDPSNINCRLKLMGYYFKTCHEVKSDSRKQLQCVLWMIEKIPDHETLGTPWAEVHKECNPQGYDKCKKLWLMQLAKYPDNVSIVTNAASFLRPDWRLAEKLYERAIALEPNNPFWYRKLALLLQRAVRKNSPRMRKALAAMQDAVRKTKELYRRRYLYDHLAEIAYEAGEWSVAENAAKKSLSLSGKIRKDWYDGNAIHNGNCILGRLALRSGQLKKAISHLDRAGQTYGSPQLNSFGPNMRFAQEMLRAGQREAVIRYLNECKRFWEGKSETLSDCIAQIERGKSPRLPRVI